MSQPDEERWLREAASTASVTRWLAVFLLVLMPLKLLQPFAHGFLSNSLLFSVMGLAILVPYALLRWHLRFRNFAPDRIEMKRSRAVVRDALTLWALSPLVLVVVGMIWVPRRLREQAALHRQPPVTRLHGTTSSELRHRWRARRAPIADSSSVRLHD